MNYHLKDPKQPAKACIIWLHGLGANAQNMMGVVDLLSTNLPPIRHVFMDAPVRAVTINNHMKMQAWYDIVGIKLTDREDREGILASETLIQAVVDKQQAEGFEPKRIYLAGFSQGGAMALFSGLRSSAQLGGVISLSAYLPLVAECKPLCSASTPIFMACGDHDPIVLPNWTKQSYDWLLRHDFNKIAWRQYPMEHMICMDEIKDLSYWLNEYV